ILNRLLSKNESGPFQMPVDPIALGIPDYVQIVKNPMDFSTIGQKLDTGRYTSLKGFVADIRLIFDNCRLYNGRE
ncbi:Bromodomain-containing protein, partial [Thamnocephalis sphaerospora]